MSAHVQRLGRYELLDALGRGGMAEVFVARLVGPAGFAKPVAIKRMLPHLATDAQFAAMFVAEARVAAGLVHPNICQIIELGEEEGELFIAMELLDGLAWDRAIASAAPIDARLVAGVLAQAADGLDHAHQRGVIHRDVSPQNLFVTIDGACKVLDFGVAKLAADGVRTRSGVVKGKLPYMAPEQLRGEPLDARADVFALGVVAWESLAGAPLFHRQTDYLVYKAIADEPIPTITSRRPELPAAVDDVIAHALSRDRAARFASTRAFAAALVSILGAASPAEIAAAIRALHVPRAPAIAPPPTRATVALRREPATIVPRKRRAWLLALPVLAAAIGIVAFVATRHKDESAPSPPPPAGGLITSDQASQLDQAIDILTVLNGSADPRLEQLRRLRQLAPTGSAGRR